MLFNIRCIYNNILLKLLFRKLKVMFYEASMAAKFLQAQNKHNKRPFQMD